MPTTLISPDTNSIPLMGQLLYKEYQDSDSGQLAYADLAYIDSPVEEGRPLLYTTIAHMEDFGEGEGMEVYTEFASGSMPAKYTRIATDNDVKSFIKLILKDGVNDIYILSDWLYAIGNEEPMQDSEKARLEQISFEVVKEMYKDEAVTQLKQSLEKKRKGLL